MEREREIMGEKHTAAKECGCKIVKRWRRNDRENHEEKLNLLRKMRVDDGGARVGLLYFVYATTTSQLRFIFDTISVGPVSQSVGF